MSRSWPMLMLRGSTYYYHRNVPRRVRPLLGGKKQIWKSLRTSDLDVAKLRSLEEGQRVERQFQDLKRRATAAQTNPDSLARLYSSRAESDDASWRRTRTVEDDEQLDVELDALKSAVQDHADALRRKDVGLVDRLLDEVLAEHGVTIPAARRRDFALALLKARVGSLEVGVRRTRAELADNPSEEQGLTVDGLLEAYLAERKLGSKSQAEVRAAYRRFSAIEGSSVAASHDIKQDDQTKEAEYDQTTKIEGLHEQSLPAAMHRTSYKFTRNRSAALRTRWRGIRDLALAVGTGDERHGEKIRDRRSIHNPTYPC